MKLNLTIKVSLRIILLFTVAILISLVGDNLHLFFSDDFCNGNISNNNISNNNKCQFGYNSNYYHGQIWHWGYRHWLFFYMGLSLTIVQIVNIVIIIDKE